MCTLRVYTNLLTSTYDTRISDTLRFTVVERLAQRAVCRAPLGALRVDTDFEQGMGFNRCKIFIPQATREGYVLEDVRALYSRI